jgi:hypothetical protein
MVEGRRFQQAWTGHNRLALGAGAVVEAKLALGLPMELVLRVLGRIQLTRKIR